VATVYAIALPFLLCFMYNTDTNASTAALQLWVGASVFMDLFCIADLVLKRTTFRAVEPLDAGGLEKDASGSEDSERRVGGLSIGFAMDIFASIPLDLIVFLPGMHALRSRQWLHLSLLQLNKLPVIYDAIRASGRLVQDLERDWSRWIVDGRLRFLRSLFAFVYACHILGCIWYRVSVFAFETYEASWISGTRMMALDRFESLESVSIARRYLRATYGCVQSATTTYYGEISSLNPVEIILETLINVVCIFVFGALVGAQGERIDTRYRRHMAFEQHIGAVFLFLKVNDVPRPVQQQIRQYFASTWLQYQGQDGLDGVQGLSTLLVEDISTYTLRQLVAKVSIFRSCDPGFLRALLPRLKRVLCAPDEVVVRKGDVDRSMYLIARGQVLVTGPGFELVKQEGDFFGELSLLYGIPRSATCSALGSALLYVLEWETYEALLADFPEYRQQNRREWVVVSATLQPHQSERFRAVVGLAACMLREDWRAVDAVLRAAKARLLHY